MKEPKPFYVVFKQDEFIVSSSLSILGEILKLHRNNIKSKLDKLPYFHKRSGYTIANCEVRRFARGGATRKRSNKGCFL